MYGEASTLTFLHDTFKGTPLFQRIKNIVFGNLFEIPAGRCPYSGKLIHSLLSRQLLTKRKYELWTVFGGQPFRFSLPEFRSITGLPCGPWPDGYHPLKANDKGIDQAWKSIIGDNPNTTCDEIGKWLADDKKKDMIDPERTFKLALILIVDGVLKANNLPLKPTPHYVTMLSDLDAFLAFPWGRESFFWTMKPTIRVFGDPEDPVETLRDKLKGGTYRLTGFPLVLQLLAFRVVPKLLQKLRNPQEKPTMLAIDGPSVPIKGYISQNSVLLAEVDPGVSPPQPILLIPFLLLIYMHKLSTLFIQLLVTPLLPLEESTISDDCGWDDEHVDNKVDHLENQIAAGHSFQKQEWPGGEDLLPILRPKQPKPKRRPNQPIVRRKQQTIGNTNGDNATQFSLKTKVSRQKHKEKTVVHAAAFEDLLQNNQLLRDELGLLSKRIDTLTAKERVVEVAFEGLLQDNKLLREELGQQSKQIDTLTTKHRKLLQLFTDTRRAARISTLRLRCSKLKRKSKQKEPASCTQKGEECCLDQWFAAPHHLSTTTKVQTPLLT